MESKLDNSFKKWASEKERERERDFIQKLKANPHRL